MSKLKQFFRSFTGFEWALWIGSVAVTVAAFLLTGNTQYYYLFGSVLGATALILVSKGNVAGQILVVFFSIFYAAVSYRLRYFGEMITYLGMSLPIAVVAVVTWLKNPFRGNKTEVTVNHISASEYVLLVLGGIAVTVAFYFILRAEYRQSHPLHRFRLYQFSRRLSDDAAKPLLCDRIRDERRRPDSPMGACGDAVRRISFHGDLFLCLSGKRPLRIRQLAEAPQAAGGSAEPGFCRFRRTDRTDMIQRRDNRRKSGGCLFFHGASA